MASLFASAPDVASTAVACLPIVEPSANRAHFTQVSAEVTMVQAHFADHVFERHSHDDVSIAVTTFGVQRFRSRGKRHDSHVGELVLLNADQDHDGEPGVGEGYGYQLLQLAPSFVGSCLDDGFDGIHFSTPHATDRTMVKAFMSLTRSLRSCDGEALRGEVVLRDFVGSMLVRHGERHRLPGKTNANGIRLDAVKEYIRVYFQRDITVAELAEVAGLSRAHLTRAFGQAFHVPPHVYLNAVRIAHAKKLIALGVPLSAVAVDCGYVDQSHLARRFKGSVGTSPSAWRRMRMGSGAMPD